MNETAIGEQQTLRRQGRILLFGAVVSVVLGAAAFLWGDLVLPAERVAVLGWTLGQSIGAVHFVGGAFLFLLYSRTRSRLERAAGLSKLYSDANG